MKNIKNILILFLIVFSSCEKVIDLEVPSIEPKLVIDASFNVLFNESPITAESNVKLTLTADYFDEAIPVVTNAIVFLTDLSNNTVINFNDVNADGNYTPTNYFIPADNIPYELTVIYNNETYKGKATKIKSTSISNITQGDETFFSGEEVELKITFIDNFATEDFYIFNIDKVNYLPIDDSYFNGSSYSFSYFYEDENIQLPQEVVVKLTGVHKDYYSYFTTLNSQSGQSGGGPFQPVPTALLGNMTNTTNEDNFPLGYFRITETDIQTITLIEKS